MSIQNLNSFGKCCIKARKRLFRFNGGHQYKHRPFSKAMFSNTLIDRFKDFSLKITCISHLIWLIILLRKKKILDCWIREGRSTHFKNVAFITINNLHTIKAFLLNIERHNCIAIKCEFSFSNMNLYIQTHLLTQ